MKKGLILLLLTVVFIGCKPKQTVTSTKLDNKAEFAIKGDWIITSVTYPGSDYIKVTSFGLADSKCFVGSTWKFVSNNNTGEMAFNNSTCAPYSSPFTWYINNDGNFVMKIINNAKAKKVLDGYVLNVANLSEKSFQLIDKTNVGGKTIEIVYEFEKK
jgi:hypothetical protein